MFNIKNFTTNLRKARISCNLTQEDLAKILYVSPQSVSKWERGNSLPDIAHICALADVFQIPVDALLGSSSGKEPGLIAVDGGGSKTEFILFSPQGQIIKRLLLPGSNPNTLGIDGCCSILQQGIDKLLQEHTPILGIHIGCAGMFSGNNAANTYKLLHTRYPEIPLTCQSDICNLLAFAQDPDNAIATICGTGCVVYASRNGTLIRSGGGGWRLDTLGSGYDMGRQTILAAMEHRDGTGPATSMTEAVEKRLGGRVWEKISEIYAQPPSYVASFTPILLNAWQEGDSVAEAYVTENCLRLAQLINAAAKQSPNAKEVLFGGSVVTQCAPLREKILSLLDRPLTPGPMNLPQVWGSFLCCVKACGLEAPSPELFIRQYDKEK